MKNNGENYDRGGLRRCPSPVRRAVGARAKKAASSLTEPWTVGPMLSGKMLRSRLGARLFASGMSVNKSTLQAVCVATELVHTASLCHDGVVDEPLGGCPDNHSEVSPTGNRDSGNAPVSQFEFLQPKAAW